MPTSEQIQQAISEVNDQESFIQRLLVHTLDWPIPEIVTDIEDMTTEWTDEELQTDGLSGNVLTGPALQLRPIMKGQPQPWGVFLLEFANEDVFTTNRGLTGPLRKVLRGLTPKRRGRPAHLPAWDSDHLLFICTHQYRHFRFAYFKSPKKKGHAEPLTTFGWGPNTPARTACEFNLPELAWPDDLTPDSWVKRWTDAFNVEKVTRQFYEDYEAVFDRLQNQIEGLTKAEEKKIFAQTLLNRLMFLRFVERKGWLKFGEDDQAPLDYLRKLFQAGPTGGASWYSSRLKVLFFQGLAIPDHNLQEIVGDVPYLNGGLFESTELDDRVTDIPDDAFTPLLSETGLLYRYNFTVEESTPLDVEVAVDPEMLGKVFEKLTNARRQRGSYYTPRTVVSFMCRETLKGYLGGYYSPLIDEDQANFINVPVARDILGRLAVVKVVDPACGSGAYLLGMLQELFRLTSLLDTRAETETPRDAYHRKLAIIQNNLYGVDIDDFAINIARLRLWLSLAVQYEGDQPEPLPNLDFKIEVGDSLAAPDPSGAGQMDFIRQQQINDYERLKAIHMNPRLRAGYPDLEAEIAQLKEQIAEYSHPDETVDGFDWRVEFAEVWSQSGGFDIVLANPPYGVTVDDRTRNQYFDPQIENQRGQSKDSYGIFMARGLQLLRGHGTLSYIVSDTWRTIKSHRPLRRRLLDTTTVFHVLDLPPWIFDATVNTGVVTLKKTPLEPDHKLIAGDLHAIPNGDWKLLSDNLTAVSGHGPDIQTLRCARYTVNQEDISKYDNLSFFVGSPLLFELMKNKGYPLEQHAGYAWRRLEMNSQTIALAELKAIGSVRKGLATGDNRRFYYKEADGRGNYEIVAPSHILQDHEISSLTHEEKMHGVDPEHYEGRFLVPLDKGEQAHIDACWLPNYFVRHKFYVDWSRAAVNNIYALGGMRNPRYQFKEGISFSWTGFYAPTFRINTGCVFDQSSSCIFQDLYDGEVLLGLLTSKLVKYITKVFCDHTVNSTASVIGRIVVPYNVPTEEIRSLVSAIIGQQIQDATYPYWQNEQCEIERLVNQAYGLISETVREVTLWYCRRYSALAEAQGIVAEVQEKYAAHLARCEMILSKPPSYWRSNPVLELVAQCESHTLEFKETLQYNIHTNRADNDVLHSSLKTIAAFLNADGGTLLIGVSDAGEIEGLARDLPLLGRHANNDGFELKIRNAISGQNSIFTPHATGYVEISFVELAEGTICRIDVIPLPRTSVLHFDNEVYIRDGNRTLKLEGPALTDWIQQRRP